MRNLVGVVRIVSIELSLSSVWRMNVGLGHSVGIRGGWTHSTFGFG